MQFLQSETFHINNKAWCSSFYIAVRFLVLFPVEQFPRISSIILANLTTYEHLELIVPKFAYKTGQF